MAEHTPGPWRLFPGERYGIESADDFSVVVFGLADDDCGINGRSPDEAAANARLIAAAPGLLEALKAMVGQECGDKPLTDAERVAVAAIAKAEGRV